MSRHRQRKRQLRRDEVNIRAGQVGAILGYPIQAIREAIQQTARSAG